MSAEADVRRVRQESANLLMSIPKVATLPWLLTSGKTCMGFFCFDAYGTIFGLCIGTHRGTGSGRPCQSLSPWLCGFRGKFGASEVIDLQRGSRCLFRESSAT